MSKAAVYTRVSTSGQGDGASLETQRAECERYCERAGLVVVAEYQDLQSGLKSDREQYQEMLAQARGGAFEVIVCWKMDRFGRDRLESGWQIKELQQIGVRVDSATEPNDSPLLRDILMAFAEEESRRISIRVSANKKTLAQQGKWSGIPPFGYSCVPHPEGGRVLEPNQDAPLVAEVFKRYLTGRYTLADLRDYLSAHSTAPRRPTRRSSVHKLLTNPVYAGVIRFGRQSHSRIQIKSPAEIKAGIFEAQGQHPAIVDPETFADVQDRLARNQLERNGRPKTRHQFVGLVWCRCGSRYSAHRTTGGGVSYYCSRRTDSGKCDNRSVTEKRVRETVLPPLEDLIRALNHEDMGEAIMARARERQQEAESKDRGKKSRLVKELKKEESRLAHLEDMRMDLEISKERYLQRRDGMESRIEAIKSELESQPHKALAGLDRVTALAERIQQGRGDDADWRLIVEEAIERVEVQAGGELEVAWKPDWHELLVLAGETPDSIRYLQPGVTEQDIDQAEREAASRVARKLGE